MEVVAVERLPGPHGLRCGLSDEWRTAIEQAGLTHATMEEIARWSPTWITTRDPDDLARCGYHQEVDWRKIADLACRAFDEAIAKFGPEGDATHLPRRRFLRGLRPQEKLYLGSLFADPICWLPTTGYLTNGQRRSCALRAAGAPYVPVEVR